MRSTTAALFLTLILATGGCGEGTPDAASKAQEGGPAPDAAGDAGDSAGAAAEPAAAGLRPAGGGAPPPPSPLPALNGYASSCLRVELPQDGADLGPFVADCCGQLLEVLRATVGARALAPEAVGERLRDTEVAVRHLDAGATAGDAAERTAAATAALAALAGDVVEGAEGAPAAALEELAAAAAAVDGGRPLAEQAERLGDFFAAADAVVRPVIRSAAPASPPPPAA